MRAAAERMTAPMAVARHNGILGTIQCGAHDSVVSHVAVLGMSVAARVMLSPEECFLLLARTANLVSKTRLREWTQHTAAHVAFLMLGAKYEWAIGDGVVDADPQQKSPQSGVTVDWWEEILSEMTQIPQSHSRISQVQIVCAM